MPEFPIISGLRIQYVSNLTNITTHEYASIVCPSAPYLAIVCKVDNYDFLEYCSKHWKKIFLLEGDSYTFDNVIVLNNKIQEIQTGISMIGCIDHHFHERLLKKQIEHCNKHKLHVIVVTSRFPTNSQSWFLRSPVVAWIAGIHDQTFVDIYTNSPIFMGTNPWNKPGFNNKLYMKIHTDKYRPDESSVLGMNAKL